MGKAIVYLDETLSGESCCAELIKKLNSAWYASKSLFKELKNISCNRLITSGHKIFAQLLKKNA